MKNASVFCTCTSTDCPLHPTNHDKGCTPCISKNLNSREIPNCFFNAADGSDKRSSWYFEDFAEAVLNKEHKNTND